MFFLLCRTKTSFVQRTDFKQLLDKCNGNMQVLKQELTEFNSFTLHLHNKNVQPQMYRSVWLKDSEERAPVLIPLGMIYKLVYLILYKYNKNVVLMM